ncbi:MAG: GGDEF domain-containing protein [Pseudomonadota bacterium]
MNDTPHRSGNSSSEAEAQLAKLNGQVSAMRAVLVQLLQEVVVAEARLDHGGASLLLKANEELVVSAPDAQTDAETAHGALDEASRVGGLDPLTGVPNRTVLLDRFELAIANARRHGNRVALLFLDLDAFKQINDTFGHASGDRALQLVADCLSSLVRETDTVSRHGGDEFLVLLAEVTNAADAAVVADKVNAALASYSQIDGHGLQLRASIGIGVYPEDGEDAKALIAFADAAMYLAKKQALAGAVLQGGPSPARATPHESRQRPRSAREPGQPEQEQRQTDLRDANESLILAALGAQDLLAAAEEARRRQAELLAMVANELSDPYAPIRLAASTLGIPGAEATLLPRVQVVIEEQAERLARMVREVLGQQGRDSG